MAFVRERDSANTESFSYLYLANVLGAMCGTISAAVVLIEVLGFRQTLALTALFNFFIAAVSVTMGRRISAPTQAEAAALTAAEHTAAPDAARSKLLLWILFSTGFSTMAMEVVWTRAFTPILQTQVYSFAAIVFTYLGATFFGSWLYRLDLRAKARRSLAGILVLLAVAAFLPILTVDPRFIPAEVDLSNGMYVNGRPWAILMVLAGICPLCAVLGYLTPGLVDQYARGQPTAAGKAYSVNVVGCILGPLFASYVLLPFLSERLSMILLGLPLLALCLACGQTLTIWQRSVSVLVSLGALAWCLFGAGDIAGMYKKIADTQVRRDYAASVISYGHGFHRLLLVNGVGMTILTPETKFMVHLPMAFHQPRPQSILLICFGMGTSYRSALSWDVPTTAVELVPSVRDAFGFYHADAAACLSNPKGRVVIDDGRRFLNRTQQKYDVVVIDPPPPVEAAGSSLLYSKDFYDVVKRHLNRGGIMQVWFPVGPLSTLQAILRSLHESFTCVRCFDGINDWGVHFLASMEPIAPATGQDLADRMPPRAQKDLLEWQPNVNVPAYLNAELTRESRMTNVLDTTVFYRVTDDHPFNEYFLLRKWQLYAP
jgi:predicted membrane-bound spermidine synthase